MVVLRVAVFSNEEFNSMFVTMLDVSSSYITLKINQTTSKFASGHSNVLAVSMRDVTHDILWILC